MNVTDYPRKVFRFLMTMKLHSLLARLALRYLLRWGKETNSLSHRIALTYLLHKGLVTNSLFVRLALTYMLNGGFDTNFVLNKLVRAYLVNKGLDANYLFDTISRAYMNILGKGLKNRNLFDKMAFMYLLKRCDEAIHKGVSVRGFGDIFDFARREGGNLIDENLQRISKTPMTWETAKLAVAYRSIEVVYEENIDYFTYIAEIGYWTGALERLRQLEKEENSESD
uniref:Uncharacterized protein n=1 Tax=Clermontia fauriei TaxID=138094 RepID=A0A1Z2QS01_9ASTR|nr:hypothetical protein Cl_fau1Pt0571 [Clermontia fauriei]ASA34254.1 hypothetical protein Cl_fau1Pt0571 [Clermontia fauriei]